MLPHRCEWLQVGTKRYDLRFWDAVDSTFDVSAVLQCKVCPAAPARWAALPSEGEDSGLAVDSAGAWAVPAGVPFRVLLELQDAFGNRRVVAATPSSLWTFRQWHA